MSQTPRHKIYADDGVTLVYTIEDVVRRDPPISIDVPSEVELNNFRGTGAITIDGGLQPYDITIYARLAAADYAALITAIETLTSSIPVKTNLYLKYDKTLTHDESLESIKVRLKSIQIDTSRGNLNKFCYYTLIFRANSW